jgi:polyisoprenoid-binding protein YceI
MKRYPFVFGIALFALVAFSQAGTQAGRQTFADRFPIKDTKMGESGAYNFDKAHSFIGFKVKHNGLIDVPGFFREFIGTVNFDSQDVTRSSVEFTAKVTSVDTGVAPRDAHLRRADFFEVEKYPDLTFKSTKVEKKGNDHILTGDLTMRGVTKSISFPFQITGWMPPDQRSSGRMGITAQTTLNRRDYGVNYGTDATLSDVVKIDLQIEAVKPRPTPASTPAAE